ncbi:5'-nucleotidase C-terminal domain-containing protein [Bacillus thermotolerans]|uniref:5'-nucleotidase C-terminal domain-containing protein n=1 Tax=Bacillus thermotolerans TaxID=1221996 RepID=UPI00058306E8|nr:5'-nucleotidase C-terminal domain-containing protein [Bacillus thermotolerans]KKB33601.1 5'-nucleotidase [Bacillus thermotolerans]
MASYYVTTGGTFAVKKVLNLLFVAALALTSQPALTAEAESNEPTSEDLFISEYVEGSSFNKAIEIYNGTGTSINLADYQLQLYSNGSSEPSQSVTLSGTLDSNDVFVAAHEQADEAILAQADLRKSSVVNFNGDDAIALSKNGTIIDVIGDIGSKEEYAENVTLIRNAAILSGSSVYKDTEWTSHPSDTFNYLGSHLSDESDIEVPQEPVHASSIAEVRELTDGTQVTVEGIVTADSTAISNGSQLTTYIQDETGGINVFAFEQGTLPSVQQGDRIKVSGELDSYKGLKEILPSSIDILESGQPLPEVQSITLADLQDPATAEAFEGERVKVTGFINKIPSSPAGGGYNVSFVDADYNGTTLRVMEKALDLSAVEPEKWYEVTAIVSQYDSYQLLPVEQGDIQLADEQPEAPSAAGTYESTVSRITDGDTLHLETPVLGTTKVRFVNMDTAETYTARNNDSSREEINANQKEHGEQAKAYLHELLQPGEKVLIKVGEEPTDDYGRLLAEVIRAKDGVNANLEMVRKGHAVTYFIAPFDEAVYPDYQAAVKEAKDAGLGIWNPENPLLELPFVFRANDDQKGFSKYVGNSDTNTYVSPDHWEQVPVEKRVFFWDEATAQQYGYTPANATEDASGDPLSVQLLGMNDLHGKIDQSYSLDPDGDGTNGTYGRIDYTAAAIKAREAENPNTLIVHAGDMIGGSSPVSGLLQDEPTVEIMEAIGFDVGTVGNHEFDEGTEELLRIVNGGKHPNGTDNYDGLDSALLCANCVYKDSGDTILPAYDVKEVDGEKIGFIGVITQEAAGMVMPHGIADIEFTNEAEAVNKAVTEMKADGVEAIVVLAHIPGSQSGETVSGQAADLAMNVDDEVDVIFSAHNHVVNNGIVDNKLIVQASEYGKAFADVDLEIDRSTGDIIQKEAEIVFVDQSEVTPDEEVTSILTKYEEKIAPVMNEIVGYNAADLTGSYTGEGGHGLGNLIADGMRAAMDSDFAMMNGGGIRDDLLAGEITWGELYNIQPFGNTLMMFEIKGKDLYPIIQAQLSPTYGPDYSISGFHYTWDPETNEVTSITFPDGTPIRPEETYTLTVNNYMGTSSSPSHAPISELGQNPVMGPADIDATVDFVKSLNSTPEDPITYSAEERITTAKASDPQPKPQPDTPEAVINPKQNNGTATVKMKDLQALEPNTRVTIDISNDKKSRALLLNKKQVDLLREKNVTLIVTDNDKSAEFVMKEYEGTVLKVKLSK